MTFCSDNQNPNEIISSVIENNGEFTIDYMDGNSCKYCNSNENHSNELENIIIEQAKERDRLEYKRIDFRKNISLLIWISSNINLLRCDRDYILLFIIFSLVSGYYFFDNYIKLSELKKYRLLLENYKEIKENPSINKCVYFDDIYVPNLDVFGIDFYTYNDMKQIKKELTKK